MVCPRCGNNAGNAKYCPECGFAIPRSDESSCGVQENKANVVRRNPKSSKPKTNIFIKGFILVMVLGMAWALISALMFTDGNTVESIPTSSPVIETEAESLLAFDEKTWAEFVNLYTAHNNLMSYISAYSSGNVDSVTFYQKCEEFKKYFATTSLSFDYGTSKDEKEYLSVFTSMALSDQAAAEALMKYLDSGKTSDLAKAEENIQSALEAATTIASNRGILLVQAGLTQEEVEKKVQADMAALEQ